MTKRLLNVLIALDQLAYVLLTLGRGSPDETLSAAAWRQRGRAELSDVGKQERIRISLPVLTETGVITPGQFVRYRTGPQQTTTGIVRGTAIDWQRPRLRQTLEIEAHEFV